MAEGMYRIGIVGATSLLGKELSDELQESLLAASDFVLLDDEDEAAGQVTSVGDEAAFVQQIDCGLLSCGWTLCSLQGQRIQPSSTGMMRSGQGRASST